MKKILNFTIPLLVGTVVNVCLMAPAQDAGQPVQVTIARAPFSWPIDRADGSKITKSQIVELLNAMNAARAGSSAPLTKIDVQSYSFAVLEDKLLYLVAVTDDSPMKWFQEISIVRCSGVRCTWSRIHSEGTNDLNKQVLDLGGDGTNQIVGIEFVIPEERQGLFKYYVYSVTKGAAKDDSPRFPQFYESRVLPTLVAADRDATPDELNPPETMEEIRAELQYARMDIQRRVRGEQVAGLSDALGWEHSPNKYLNKLALQTFEEVDSPDADVGLKRMTESGTPWIRESAQAARIRKAERQRVQAN